MMAISVALTGCTSGEVEGATAADRVGVTVQGAPAVRTVTVPADARGPVAAGLLQAVPPAPAVESAGRVSAGQVPAGQVPGGHDSGEQRAARSGGERATQSGHSTGNGSAQAQRPAAPAPAPAPASDGGRAAAVAAAVNAQRTNRGLAALPSSSCAVRYAQRWATHLASTGAWGHQSLGPVLSGCSASRVGENIAKGSGAAAETVSAWMGSPGHRANILEARWTHAGMASAQAPDGRWLTVQVFLTL